mgnify:CR=1 FL=1
MGVLRHVRSSPVALLVLLLAHVHGARFLASADAQVLVRDSISFWAALSSDGVQTVLLNSSLVLNTAPPGGTLALKRNVTVQPTAADGSVKAFVDFRDQVGDIVEPGCFAVADARGLQSSVMEPYALDATSHAYLPRCQSSGVAWRGTRGQAVPWSAGGGTERWRAKNGLTTLDPPFAAAAYGHRHCTRCHPATIGA